MNRRRFLKYTGAAAAGIGASTLGLDYLVGPRFSTLTQTAALTQPATGSTSALDKIPPTIEDLQWEPTRVVNCRVYDGRVSFAAEDESGIAEALLEFKPVSPSYLPPGTFPEEESKTIQLQPGDGAGSRHETFYTDISDLKGGKEYTARANVKDGVGNASVGTLGIPYVRGYEKFSSKRNVGAIYRPYHLQEFPQSTYTQLMPLINYDSAVLDDIVSTHIDWATGHGVDTFIHDWNGPSTPEDSLIKRFMNNPLSDNVKAAVDIETQWRFTGTSHPGEPPEWKYYDFNDSSNRKTFLSDINYLLDTYMIRKEYLKLRDKPVLFFWDSKSIIGDFPSAFREADRIAKERGYDGLFYYGCEIGGIFVDPKLDKEVLRRAEHFDAISIWAAGYSGESTELGEKIRRQHAKLLRELYAKWSRALRGITALVPSVIPGFDGRKVWWGNPDEKPLPRDLGRFEEELRGALTYADEELKMVRIDTWNDWYENTQIEPSKDEGFQFLSTLKTLLDEAH